MKTTSLKKKLLVWFGGVTAFVLFLFSFSFYYVLNDSVNDTIKTKLKYQAQETEEALEEGKLPFGAYAILENEIVIHQTADFNVTDLSRYIKSGQNFFILHNEGSYETIDALYLYKGKKNMIAAYQRDIDNEVEDLVSTLLVLDPILFLFLVFMASRMIDKILIPINDLIKATQEISVNNFSTTLPFPEEKDEISELVDAYNEMIHRLKAGVASLDRFNSDVSHELKTPLTVILGEIEVTLRKTRTSSEYEKSLDVVYQEAKQMKNIVENLLLLTKYTKENIKDSFESCQLDEILSTVIEKYALALQSKNIMLHKKIDNVSMIGNPLLLNLVFSNLIDNAIKYSTENRNIFISLYEQKGIHFNIIDEGIGIDEIHIPKITDRFYRIDESRNKKVEGFGLGLSLVKYGVDLHNGKMNIRSRLGEGTNIAITF